MLRLIAIQWAVAVIILVVGVVLSARAKRAVTASAHLTEGQPNEGKKLLWSKAVKHSLILTGAFTAIYAFLKFNYFAEQEGLFTSAAEARSETWTIILIQMIINLPRVFILAFGFAFFLSIRRGWRKNETH